MTTFHPLPPGPFKVILCDPPWSFRNYKDSTHAKSRWVGRHYGVVDLDDLKALPVASVADPDCALFLWATLPMLPEALALMEAWGFQYKTVAFTWAKLTSTGKFWHCGMGYWTRSNAEMCLLGVRKGGRPKRVSKKVRQLVVAPVGEHSAKPAKVHGRIEELMGDVPRLELFARAARPGWTVWGNEVEPETKYHIINFDSVDQLHH